MPQPFARRGPPRGPGVDSNATSWESFPDHLPLKLPTGLRLIGLFDCLPIAVCNHPMQLVAHTCTKCPSHQSTGSVGREPCPCCLAPEHLEQQPPGVAAQ